MTRSTVLVLKAATLLGIVPSVLVALAVFWPGPDLVTSRGYYLGQDFVNLWTGGHLALEGRLATIYDRDAYDAVVKGLFPPATGFLNFSYPPHILPLLTVLALLPYGVALALWQVLGLAGFLAVSLAGAERGKALDLMPWLVLSPVVILVVTVGQASFFLAVLFVGALRLLPARPLIAGMLLGLLTIKPQLGILLPPALIVMGERRAFVSAAASAAVLVTLSIVLFGIGPWQDYVSSTLPFQQRVLTEMVGLYPAMMITPYAEFWWLGVPASTALVLHGVVAACVLAGALLALRLQADAALKIAILALASLMVTPYCLNYDIAIPAAAIVFWLSRGPEPLAPSTLAALGVFWLVPYLGMALVLWHWPIMPVAVLALFAALLHEAWRQGAPLAALPAAARGT